MHLAQREVPAEAGAPVTTIHYSVCPAEVLTGSHQHRECYRAIYYSTPCHPKPGTVLKFEAEFNNCAKASCCPSQLQKPGDASLLLFLAGPISKVSAGSRFSLNGIRYQQLIPLEESLCFSRRSSAYLDKPLTSNILIY